MHDEVKTQEEHQFKGDGNFNSEGEALLLNGGFSCSVPPNYIFPLLHDPKLFFGCIL